MYVGQFLTSDVEFDNEYKLVRFNNHMPIPSRKGPAWYYFHIKEDCWFGTFTDNQGAGVIEKNYVTSRVNNSNMDYVVQELIP